MHDDSPLLNNSLKAKFHLDQSPLVSLSHVAFDGYKTTNSWVALGTTRIICVRDSGMPTTLIFFFTWVQYNRNTRKVHELTNVPLPFSKAFAFLFPINPVTKCSHLWTFMVGHGEVHFSRHFIIIYLGLDPVTIWVWKDWKEERLDSIEARGSHNILSPQKYINSDWLRLGTSL